MRLRTCASAHEVMIPEEETRLVARHRTQIAGAGATGSVPVVRRDVGRTRTVILVLERIHAATGVGLPLQQTYIISMDLGASIGTGRTTHQTARMVRVFTGTIPTEQIISTI